MVKSLGVLLKGLVFEPWEGVATGWFTWPLTSEPQGITRGVCKLARIPPIFFKKSKKKKKTFLYLLNFGVPNLKVSNLLKWQFGSTRLLLIRKFGRVIRCAWSGCFYFFEIYFYKFFFFLIESTVFIFLRAGSLGNSVIFFHCLQTFGYDKYLKFSIALRT